MTTLPPSLQRRSAGRQHEREQRLLHHFSMMRAVRMGIVWKHAGDPDLVTWENAAHKQGYDVEYDIVDDEGRLAMSFSKDGEVVFIGIEVPTGAVVAPVE